MTDSKAPAKTYYSLLGLPPSASVQEIRRAYRDRSKLYHPDTTELPTEVAKAKFQQLNEAYATLSSPERRIIYDQKIGYSRISVIQAPVYLNQPISRGRSSMPSAKTYLDPSDRPLSAGEIFALFLLGITFAACLALVVAIGLTQGEAAFYLPPPPETTTAIDLKPVPAPSTDSPTSIPPAQPANPTASLSESAQNEVRSDAAPPLPEASAPPPLKAPTIPPTPASAEN